MRRAIKYSGFRFRQEAWVWRRRAAWHSAWRQARCRTPTRGSGRNHRRQMQQGLFRVSGIGDYHHRARKRGQRGLSRKAGGSILSSRRGSILASAEGKEAQTRFAYKTGATQVLFLQHVIDSLKPGGRCGIVLDEGVLFRTNETAFVQTKRKLLDDCDLWCIVSLPGGVFTAAGAGVKTNLLFFTKGQPTEKVWYYDLSDIKVGKKKPFTLDKFEDFFRLLPTRGDSDRSWTVTRAEIEAKNFDLKAVNPNAKSQEDTRTPEELLDIIEAKGKEVAEAVAALRRQ